MITYKYGKMSEDQLLNYKNRLHSLVHWLLIYEEENADILSNYFKTVQYKLNGYNELMLYPDAMVEIINLVESAKIEFESGCDHELYRRIILDIHSLIDKLPPPQMEE